MDIKAQVPDAKNNVKRYVEYQDIPVTPTTAARIQFTETPFAAPLQNSESVRDNISILEIDRNGDGQYESEVKPLTSDIVLKAENILTVLVDGAGIVLPKDGYTYQEDSIAYITAEPLKGWVFDRWGGDASGTNPSISMVMDNNKTIIAYFKSEVRQFSLTIAVEGKGTTQPGPGTYLFDEGAQVTVLALPELGYELVSWGANYDVSPVLELTMNRDVSITATFRQIPVIDQINDPLKLTAFSSTNIEPETRAEQSIVTNLPVLVAVEVNIETANAGDGGDTITMKILYEGQQIVASVSQFVEEGFDGWLRFEMPEGGVSVGSGTYLTIQLEDTGKNIFHWKFDGDTYPAGCVFISGQAGPYNDFLFRTYGISGE
jgi:hypothetical protein